MRRRARDEGARGRAGGRLGSPRSPAPLERPSDAAGWPSRCVTSRTSPSQRVPTRGVERGVERRPENARGTFSDLSEKAPDLVFRWWRGQDLNLRPSGYEPSDRCVFPCGSVPISPSELDFRPYGCAGPYRRIASDPVPPGRRSGRRVLVGEAVAVGRIDVRCCHDEPDLCGEGPDEVEFVGLIVGLDAILSLSWRPVPYLPTSEVGFRAYDVQSVPLRTKRSQPAV